MRGKAFQLVKLNTYKNCFFKPHVSLNQIFFDIQQNVICLLSGMVGLRKRDVLEFCDSLTGLLSFFLPTRRYYKLFLTRKLRGKKTEQDNF